MTNLKASEERFREALTNAAGQVERFKASGLVKSELCNCDALPRTVVFRVGPSVHERIIGHGVLSFREVLDEFGGAVERGVSPLKAMMDECRKLEEFRLRMLERFAHQLGTRRTVAALTARRAGRHDCVECLKPIGPGRAGRRCRACRQPN